MTISQICICLAIAVYLIAMLGVGVWFSKRNNSVDDFYLGGRKLGPFVTAMSAEASDMSSWLLMGLPGVAYLSGLAEASWTAIGLAVGTYLNWLIVARRIRRYSHQIDAITVPQFFSKRWGDERNLLSAIAAVVIMIFFVPYLASGFSACGKLFASLFGINYVSAMLISAAVIVIYTVMGGFLAASFTDLVQSIIMTVALVVVLGFGVAQAGGMEAVMDNARSLAGYLSLVNIHDPATGGSAPYSLLTICSLLAWGLGYFGMPHILLRFMAIEEEKKLALSRRVATTWVVISMGVAVFIGVVGNGKSGGHGAAVRRGDNHRTDRQPDQLLRCSSRSAGRRDLGGYPGRHHVHCRLPAAGRLLLCLPEPGGRVLPPEDQRKEERAGGPEHHGGHLPDRSIPGPRPGQLCLPGGLIRLGGLRRRLRAGGALCSVLEAVQQVGGTGRDGHRRRDGLRVEVSGGSYGRRAGHL